MSTLDKLTFQNYLVVFSDQLGQREHLRKISGIPTTDSERGEFIEAMKSSIGRVLGMRDLFQKYFDSASSYIPNLNLVPPQYRSEFSAMQKTNISFYGLSDAIVIFVPLMDTADNRMPINGVYSAFIATSGIGLLSLSRQVPMRAGIDVGVAAQIDDKEIYGPVLEQAFYLESQLAEYPRFLVGEELINYLLWLQKRKIDTRMGQVTKHLAKFCMEMIIQDTDGRYMLDFLGEKIKESSDGSIRTEDVKSAQEYVKSEYDKYTKDNNEKMRARYYRLLRYFQSRKAVWGISE